METTTCPKCRGAKKILRYSNVANGDCFECGATGRVEVKAVRGAVQSGESDAPSAEYALIQLRCLYRSAVTYGASWFEVDADGWDAWAMVRYWAGHADATKAAQAVAAFEALAAG